MKNAAAKLLVDASQAPTPPIRTRRPEKVLNLGYPFVL
jgi:hypothetical protein